MNDLFEKNKDENKDENKENVQIKIMLIKS